jgi:hypothetical protein
MRKFIQWILISVRFADLVPDEENGDDFFPTGEFYPELAFIFMVASFWSI